ncbi:MAG: hypothetical protein AAF546_11830, partial [Verrucomicrobiota bacterium]
MKMLNKICHLVLSGILFYQEVDGLIDGEATFYGKANAVVVSGASCYLIGIGCMFLGFCFMKPLIEQYTETRGMHAAKPQKHTSNTNQVTRSTTDNNSIRFPIEGSFTI